MSGRTSKRRTRKELSKADLKAYESRRASERKRVTAESEAAEARTVRVPEVASQHTLDLTRDQEFRIIRSDLIRLLYIMGILTVALAVITVILR